MDALSGIVDDKVLRLISLFLRNPEELFHIQKASEQAKVPLSTTFRLLNSLTKDHIIEIKPVGRFKLYRLADTKQTRKLRDLL